METPVGDFAELVCRRSVSIAGAIEIYAAEGYCTWMAVECEGSTMYCGMVPTFGAVAEFYCPAGYAERIIETPLMEAVVTVAYCAPACSSDGDCRWNAIEEPDSPFVGECGQWTCYTPSDGSESFCEDLRNID
jgi:hypothetical protein